MKEIIQSSNLPDNLKTIANKVFRQERLNDKEGLCLYKKAGLGLLGVLASFTREKKNGNFVYFNRNFHIEPTNICIYNCRFCSYSRKINEKGAWEYTIDEILSKVAEYKNKPVTEVHIVGGVHPYRDLHYYGNMIRNIKKILPQIHVKAFTAIELDFMIKKSRMTLDEGLKKLKEYGLDSIPGGGAEIFREEIRKQICDEKSSSLEWLKIHETAHKTGIPSNATMLYGHIENYSDRIDHLSQLRKLQDKTGGFNTFIPLKYRMANNKLSNIGEVTTLEDMRNFAVSRIYLDNFHHIKSYWPMIGKETTQLSLSFGVDDIDGTIDDTTKIYSMAGADDKKPTLSTDQLITLINEAGRSAVERDTLYNIIREYGKSEEVKESKGLKVKE
ncbi:MAG: aminofutalosine synthase MqnE [Bacteroidetes bacterium]|nr:aminofutalosine synthase MqnE [Bacteroidota bacterium]